MPSEFEKLLVEHDGAVTTVTLNQPERRNCLDAQTLRELLAAIELVDGRRETRVLVITGADPVFCAGGDIKAFGKAQPIDHLDGIAPLIELARRMFAMTKPTVARINGLALGGGAGLASICDFALASHDAEIGYPEIHLGLFPATVGVLLARMVPRRVAADLLFTGRRIKAAEAAQLNVINRAVPADELDDAVEELTQDLASKSPIAMRQLKSSFYEHSDLPLDRALAGALDKFVGLMSTHDGPEGVRAFIEKRKPTWKGE